MSFKFGYFHMPFFLFLLFVLILGGCEAFEGFHDRFGARSSQSAATGPTQPALMPTELSQSQRHQRAVENLPHFLDKVVPHIKAIATDLIKQKKKIDPHYLPELKIIEKAVHIHNQLHPNTPITQTDMDAFYLTDEGRMAFFSLIYIGN